MGDGMDRLKARPWVAWYGLSALLLVVGLIFAPWYFGAQLWSFLLTLAGSLCLIIAFGVQITTFHFGILRDGKNGYSLSRLQMAAWTWLILSALLAVAAARLWHSHESAGALNIYIPQNLFLVMGISFFTGAATPALLSLKTQSPSTPQQLQTARDRMAEPQVVANGQVVVRQTTAPPQFSDIVEGDDLATAGTVDISKVQQLLITFLVLGTYFFMLCDLFHGTKLLSMSDDLAKNLVQQGDLLCGYANAAAVPANIQCGRGWTAMPDFPGTLVTLLAVSHGGYLVYKAAPRSAADNNTTSNVPGTTVTRLDSAKAAG
jgi:hypothetical protein